MVLRPLCFFSGAVLLRLNCASETETEKTNGSVEPWQTSIGGIWFGSFPVPPGTTHSAAASHPIGPIPAVVAPAWIPRQELRIVLHHE